MSRKTVFMLVGSLKLGGTEVLATRIGGGLASQGYDVKYVLLKNIIEIPIDTPKENLLFLGSEKHKYRLAKIIFSILRFWRYYFKYKPHRTISYSCGLNVMLMFTLIPGQSWIIDTNLFFVKKRYPRRILKYVAFIPFVKAVIINSEGQTEKFRNYLSKSAFRKLVTIYNPVELIDPAEVKTRQMPFDDYLICVGRLQKFKGGVQLVRCFMKANIPESYHLVFLGKGDEEKNIRKAIEEEDWHDRIHLLGFQKDPKGFVKGARATVLNSTFESFGNVLIESLALGVPVLSHDCDFGPREIIEHEKNGLLYDQNKDENLIAAIEEIVNDDLLYQILLENARKNLEKFELNHIVQQYKLKAIE